MQNANPINLTVQSARLVKYEAARAALEAAHSIDEVKTIRDKAEALRAYARQARDTAMINWATEIKLRAERRCGQMLKETAATGKRATAAAGRPKEVSHRGTLNLPKLGLSRNQSSRYQKLAEIPQEKFEEVLEQNKNAKSEPETASTAVMIRLHDAMQRMSDHAERSQEERRAGLWRSFRWDLESAKKTTVELRGENAPSISNVEAGKILLVWKELSKFISEELGYEDEHADGNDHS